MIDVMNESLRCNVIKCRSDKGASKHYDEKGNPI